MSVKNHWENIYAQKTADQVSWYRPHLEKSLELIERAARDRFAAIIDVGGGESTLVDDLLVGGFENVTVLDLSQIAIKATQRRLAGEEQRVRWIAGDIAQVQLDVQAYDVWHDRAVFHFLTEREQRNAYIRQVVRSVKRGGHVIVSTFGPEGPTKCSGLDVVRYDAASLHGQFGVRFDLVESSKEIHQTPFGLEQQFVYCYCLVR